MDGKGDSGESVGSVLSKWNSNLFGDGEEMIIFGGHEATGATAAHHFPSSSSVSLLHLLLENLSLSLSSFLFSFSFLVLVSSICPKQQLFRLPAKKSVCVCVNVK